MTEAEWLECEDPGAMLDVFRSLFTDRQLRLLGCCARCRWWPALTDDRSRDALVVGERFADGLATDEELDAAADQALGRSRRLPACTMQMMSGSELRN